LERFTAGVPRIAGANDRASTCFAGCFRLGIASASDRANRTVSEQEVQIYVDAAPRRVWELVADVTRMGEWSPICRRCEWMDGVTGPAVGARFVGHNRQSGLRWSRECEITSCVPGGEFGFKTFVKGREATSWLYRFAPHGWGTQVTESYEIVSMPLWVKAAYLIPWSRAKARRDGRKGMEITLRRIKRAAENLQ